MQALENTLRSSKTIAQQLTKLAVIVPFRHNHFQNRSSQLAFFIPFMSRFLSTLENRDFVIIIVEQSQDSRKFNRGKLLNIGFREALKMDCDYCIFHDVDLLPHQDMVEFYGQYPDTPIHLAANWYKYRHLTSFFGGACSFSIPDFIQANGFPNNFWGWGAEDDELLLRLKDADLAVYRPQKGNYSEMKHVHAKNVPSLVNPERDILLQDRTSWQGVNGLTDLELTKMKGPYRFVNHKSYHCWVEL